MALTNVVRNMRDGQLVINDGSGTPKSCTVILDEGDLTWTVNKEYVQVFDRGVSDHVRQGNGVNCTLSFSVKWTQLIQGSVSSADGYVPYEMFTNEGDTFTTVAGCGEAYALELVFTVTDPCGVASEVITFAEVYADTVECTEAEDANMISFSGFSNEEKPTVARV